MTCPCSPVPHPWLLPRHVNTNVCVLSSRYHFDICGPNHRGQRSRAATHTHVHRSFQCFRCYVYPAAFDAALLLDGTPPTHTAFPAGRLSNNRRYLDCGVDHGSRGAC
jgi:hypothetical protein